MIKKQNVITINMNTNQFKIQQDNASIENRCGNYLVKNNNKNDNKIFSVLY